MKRVSTLVVAGCLLAAASLPFAADPASGVTSQQALSCGLGGAQTMTIDGVAPATAAQGTPFTVDLRPALATAAGGAIKNMTWRFQIPSGATLVAGSVTTVGSFSGPIAPITTNVSGTVVEMKAAGEVPNGGTFQPPILRFQLTSAAAAGTALQIKTASPAYTLTALGSIAISCTPGTPLTAFTTTTVITTPGAPTIGSATVGDGQSNVSWTAPASNGGSAVTGYVVTPYIGATAQTAQTFNSTATTQTVTGLTNGTAYTFKVAAVNAAGTGAQSAASNAVTPVAPTTVPGAPTIGSATAGNTQAILTWTAPASNGGSAVSGYVVTPYIGATAQTAQTFNSTATTQTVTGLTNGTAYTFKVAAKNAVGTGVQSAASNSVTPFAPPVVSIGDATVTEGNSGTVSASFTVSLNTAGLSTASVGYATANGSASAPGDYTATSGSVSFAPGETSKTVQVSVAGDIADEDDETFAVNLGSPSGAVIGDGAGLGTILDDDTTIPPSPVLPAVSIGDVTVMETAGTATVPLTLSWPTSSPVSVSVSTLGSTAIAGSDYTEVAPTVVTFAPGETVKSVAVAILDDGISEKTEKLSVKGVTGTGFTLGDSAGSLNILDDDAAISATVSDGAVLEGNSGTTPTTYTVGLSRAVPAGTTVTMQATVTGGTAVSGDDFEEVLPVDLVFVTGQQTKTFTVNVKGDTTSEINETFSVKLVTLVGAVAADAAGKGTVVNDDGPKPPVAVLPSISIGDATVIEGSTTKSGSVPVRLAAASATPVTVTYASAPGSALDSDDFTTIAPTVLTFAPGETQKSIPFQVIGDQVAEVVQKFSVKLSLPVGAVLGDTAASVNIIDDDPTIAISVADTWVSEGNAGTTTMTFTVSLSRPVPVGGSVSVIAATADSKAFAGSDYDAVGPLTLTFAPGEQTKTVTVTVLGDTTIEKSETLSLKLSGALGGVIADTAALGTIFNDD